MSHHVLPLHSSSLSKHATCLGCAIIIFPPLVFHFPKLCAPFFQYLLFILRSLALISPSEVQFLSPTQQCTCREKKSWRMKERMHLGKTATVSTVNGQPEPSVSVSEKLLNLQRELFCILASVVLGRIWSFFLCCGLFSTLEKKWNFEKSLELFKLNQKI